MIPSAEKSRFRLNLEAGFYGIALFFAGLLLLLWPFVAILPVLFLAWRLKRLEPALKTRREPFTRNQKHILFSIGASFLGFLVFIFLFVAIRTQAPLAWILSVLVTLVAAGCLVLSYRQIYIDEV